MLVRMLIGPLTGQVVDLPLAAAQSELQFGTAENANALVSQTAPDIDAHTVMSAAEDAQVAEELGETESGEALPPNPGI
jgi:hypothetical protein